MRVRRSELWEKKNGDGMRNEQIDRMMWELVRSELE